MLKPFTASQMLVSNAEFLEFVEAGGYEERGRGWWSDEGWRWVPGYCTAALVHWTLLPRFVTDLGVTGPRFWVGRTHYRAMLAVIPMPWDLPVEVNNLEASAFCEWKSSQAHVSH